MKKPNCTSRSQSCGDACISRHWICRQKLSEDMSLQAKQLAVKLAADSLRGRAMQRGEADKTAFWKMQEKFPTEGPKGIQTSKMESSVDAEGNITHVLTQTAADGSGDKLQFTLLTDAKGNHYSVSDGIVKPITNDRKDSEWQEAHFAALRLAALNILPDSPSKNLPPESRRAADSIAFNRMLHSYSSQDVDDEQEKAAKLIAEHSELTKTQAFALAIMTNRKSRIDEAMTSPLTRDDIAVNTGIVANSALKEMRPNLPAGTQFSFAGSDKELINGRAIVSLSLTDSPNVQLKADTAARMAAGNAYVPPDTKFERRGDMYHEVDTLSNVEKPKLRVLVPNKVSVPETTKVMLHEFHEYHRNETKKRVDELRAQHPELSEVQAYGLKLYSDNISKVNRAMMGATEPSQAEANTGAAADSALQTLKPNLSKNEEDFYVDSNQTPNKGHILKLTRTPTSTLVHLKSETTARVGVQEHILVPSTTKFEKRNSAYYEL